MSTAEIKNEITTADKPQTVVHHDDGPLASILDTNLFNHLWRVATAYSRSTMVPDVFRGKPDDCFVAVQLALRLEVDPFMLMQSMYVVHGKPGMEAKLAIALCNSRGPFSDRIQWEFSGAGMERSCRAFAHDRASGNVCEAIVSMAIAKAEGWLDKNGSKWRTMPDQMLMYRSAAWLIRTSCPEVLMGMATSDELQDMTITRQQPRSSELEKWMTLGSEKTGPVKDVSVEPSDTAGQGSERAPRNSGAPSPASPAVNEGREPEAQPPAHTTDPIIAEYLARAEACTTIKEINALVTAAANDRRGSRPQQTTIAEILSGRLAFLRQHKAHAAARPNSEPVETGSSRPAAE